MLSAHRRILDTPSAFKIRLLETLLDSSSRFTTPITTNDSTGYQKTVPERVGKERA
jgi:hypothetical protein